MKNSHKEKVFWSWKPLLLFTLHTFVQTSRHHYCFLEIFKGEIRGWGEGERMVWRQAGRDPVLEVLTDQQLLSETLLKAAAIFYTNPQARLLNLGRLNGVRCYPVQNRSFAALLPLPTRWQSPCTQRQCNAKNLASTNKSLPCRPTRFTVRELSVYNKC